uniref:Isoform 3 of Sesquipedalian-1 n=1 Tax=Homo sapiens TaxID=9606 RepID=Q8N4B1-3|nr:FAM109A protein [Homo sapiens]
MKLNERSLAFYATCDAPVDNAGFLYKKGGRHAAYHRRWFVLRGNMLFYFEDAASREPVGVIILVAVALWPRALSVSPWWLSQGSPDTP